MRKRTFSQGLASLLESSQNKVIAKHSQLTRRIQKQIRINKVNKNTRRNRKANFIYFKIAIQNIRRYLQDKSRELIFSWQEHRARLLCWPVCWSQLSCLLRRKLIRDSSFLSMRPCLIQPSVSVVLTSAPSMALALIFSSVQLPETVQGQDKINTRKQIHNFFFASSASCFLFEYIGTIKA